MADIKEGNKGNYAKVDTNGELYVCLCDKCCNGSIKLEDLEKRFPNISISIRKEQLKNLPEYGG